MARQAMQKNGMQRKREERDLELGTHPSALLAPDPNIARNLVLLSWRHVILLKISGKPLSHR